MATLDKTTDPKVMGKECCERCGRVVKRSASRVRAHYNYNTFEVRMWHTDEKGEWGNNIILGLDCATKIGLMTTDSKGDN